MPVLFSPQVKWRINAPILDIATEAWAKDLEVGDLPKRAEVPLPEVPAGLKMTNNGIVMIARKEDYDNAEMKQLANTFRRSVKKVGAFLHPFSVFLPVVREIRSRCC